MQLYFFVIKKYEKTVSEYFCKNICQKKMDPQTNSQFNANGKTNKQNIQLTSKNITQL